MRHTDISSAHVTAKHARVPVTQVGNRALNQAIARCFEPRFESAILDHKLHVRIGEQNIVVVELGGSHAIECRVTSLFKVVEWETVQFARLARAEANELMKSCVPSVEPVSPITQQSM